MRDHYYFIPAGANLLPASLGFQALSVRVDNLSNQWLQEETTLTWIPPYTLGRTFSVYGQQTAFFLNSLPPNIPRQQPVIPGQFAVALYTEAYLNESAGTLFVLSSSHSDPVRNPSSTAAVVGTTPGPATTTYYTYTVPAGRNADLQSVSVVIARITACTAHGTVVAGVFPPGVVVTASIFQGLNISPILEASLLSNVLGHQVSAYKSGPITMLSSAQQSGIPDTFRIDYSNNETGGTVYLLLSPDILEYTN